jgi:EAL domain-containing protein (putative c-di-GMP-specific phosphodiesterase class I)
VEEFDRSLEAWAAHTHRRSEELRRALYSDGLSLSVSAVEWCDAGELESLIAVPMWPGNPPLFGRELQRVADQCGLGPELGRWTIDEGIRLAGQRSRPVAVPLATCLLTLAGTVEFIEAALDTQRLHPSHLRLLIDEDAIGDDELLSTVIEALRSLGVGLIVNGFGANVGSLCALSRYRLDAVVLAPDLVVGLGASPKQVALVDGVLRAVQALGYVTIAPTLIASADRARIHRLECEQEIVPIIDLPDEVVRRQPRLFRTAGHGAFAE